jgi:hypothetical protein
VFIDKVSPSAGSVPAINYSALNKMLDLPPEVTEAAA